MQWTGRQIGGQAGKQENIHKGRRALWEAGKADRMTGRQAISQIVRQTDRKTGRLAG